MNLFIKSNQKKIYFIYFIEQKEKNFVRKIKNFSFFFR